MLTFKAEIKLVDYSWLRNLWLTDFSQAAFSLQRGKDIWVSPSKISWRFIKYPLREAPWKVIIPCRAWYICLMINDAYFTHFPVSGDTYRILSILCLAFPDLFSNHLEARTRKLDWRILGPNYSAWSQLIVEVRPPGGWSLAQASKEDQKTSTKHCGLEIKAQSLASRGPDSVYTSNMSKCRKTRQETHLPVTGLCRGSQGLRYCWIRTVVYVFMCFLKWMNDDECVWWIS